MKANNISKITNLSTVPTVAEILACVDGPRCVRLSVTLDTLDELREGMKAAGVEVRELSEYGCKQGDEIRAKLAGLVVPGVSELVDVYGVTIEGDERRRLLVVDGVRPYLVINNRAYFVPAWSNDKRGTTYRLFLPRETAEVSKINNSEGWTYKEPEPQKISKATAKKLAAWVEYLDRREEAAREYLDRGKTAAAKLFERLDAAGAEYKRDGNKVTIYNGPLSLVVELSQSGVYIGRPSVDLGRYYQTIRANFPGEDSALSFMLNAKITF